MSQGFQPGSKVMRWLPPGGGEIINLISWERQFYIEHRRATGLKGHQCERWTGEPSGFVSRLAGHQIVGAFVVPPV